jgi:hypothetical protein
MTNSEYKILKLTSGEEIVASASNGERGLIRVTSPLKLSVNPRMTDEGVEEAISLQRWVHFADGVDFDIPKHQVVTIANASFGLVKFYEYCVKKMESEDAGSYTEDDFIDEFGDMEEEDFLDDDFDVSKETIH